MPRFIASVRELQRRRVFRGIGFYLIGAWTLLQVAEVVAEPAGLPAWTLTALLYLLLLGFPLAIWLAWRYELTDEGLVRTRPVAAGDAAVDVSLKTSDYLIFGVMTVVIGVAAWQGLGTIRSGQNADGAPAEATRETPLAAVENSVAVLPFSDLSPDSDQGFLGEGIADTVLHVLSQVRGLTVTARTSSFAFRDRQLTVQEIARELGVDHVLEGSVQRAGDELRIIARLVDARNGVEVWSGHFDRVPTEVFAIQDEIAREVVAALEIRVLDADRERLDNEYQPDLEAYELYVLGRRDLDAGNLADLESAERRFRRAIEIDPGYAQAYTALAGTYRQLGMVDPDLPMGEAIARERPLVEKALDLDPALAEAWNRLGALQAAEKDWQGAERSNQQALALNPNSPEAWAGRWNLLMLRGDQEEALAAIRKAVELDPESIRYQTSLANQLFRLARAEEAIYVLRETIRRHPEAPRPYEMLARFLNQVGRPGEAMWYLQAVRRRDPENKQVLAQICLQHWQLWDVPAAITCYEALLEAVPGDLDARKWLAYLEGDEEETVRVAELEVERSPERWYPKMQLADALARQGQWRRIAELVGSAFPALNGPEPAINDYNQWPARRLAEAYLHADQPEQATRLIDATLEWFERSRKLQAGGWTAGTEDALLHALRGDYERAMDTLERAIDRDWMFYARSVIEDTPFDPIREHPRFVGLVEQLEENVARERRWYEERKDRLQL